MIQIKEKIDLEDRELFANLAADDEDPAFLASYFVNKKDFKYFYDEDVKISVAKGRKGIGKSALAKHLAYVRNTQSNDVVCFCKASELVSDFDSNLSNERDPDSFINSWQLAICRQINREIGSRIKLALHDDQITLVELAELTGKKSRNIISAVSDRIKNKHFDRVKDLPKDDQALLERYMSRRDVLVWIIIDDLDAKFTFNEFNTMKLSTIFSACRYLSSKVEGLRIRLCIRTDVWALIRPKDESLDKAEQYIFDISWAENETRKILAKRISSFLFRKEIIREEIEGKDYDYIDLIFTHPFYWGKQDRTRPPHVILHTFSYGRPRWMLHICKLAAKQAKVDKRRKINQQDINSSLREYGKERISDLVNEHSHQCKQVRELIDAFRKTQNKFTTHELLVHIKDRIFTHLGVSIDGKHISTGDNLKIAGFLYRIGLIVQRRDFENGNYEHVLFENDPEIFVSRSYTPNVSWEIHPAYRESLETLSDREARLKKK